MGFNSYQLQKPDLAGALRAFHIGVEDARLCALGFWSGLETVVRMGVGGDFVGRNFCGARFTVRTVPWGAVVKSLVVKSLRR